MSRSGLRQAALERDKHRCAWPRCGTSDGLEMAHIWPIGMGGRKSADTLDNVWMLCRWHHDMFDGRRPQKQNEYRALAAAYIAVRFPPEASYGP